MSEAVPHVVDAHPQPVRSSRDAKSHRFDDFELDSARSELRRDGKAIAISSLSLMLLEYLLRHRDRVVAQDELLEEVWGGVSVTVGSLRQAVFELRNVLDDNAIEQRVIRTVRGRGYHRFGKPVTAGGALNCSETETDVAWQGNAITFLAGVQGQFEGGGDVADIVTGASDTPSLVRIKTGHCRVKAEVEAYSFFVGVPDQPGTIRGFVHDASAHSGQKRSTKLLATSDGLCFLTRVSGNFDGAGESINIAPQIDETGKEWWVLNARADGGSAYASAQCVQYDQRDQPWCDQC